MLYDAAMHARRSPRSAEATPRRLKALSLGLLAAVLPACGGLAAPASAARAPGAVRAESHPAPQGRFAGREQGTADYNVIDYDASIRLIPETKALSGVVRITVERNTPSAVLDLAAEELTIRSVRVGSAPRDFALADGRLRIPLSGPGNTGKEVVEIAYYGAPSTGLFFEDAAIYTIFHTGRWMPCHDVPGDKATLTLRVTAPAALDVVASGLLRSREGLEGGLATHTFRLALPHSSYLFGFAAGRFHAYTGAAGKVGLSFISADRSEAELRRIFADTEAMLRFFEERAGVPYPLERYTQVLIPGASPQEVAGFSILPSKYAKDVLEEPREDWLIAHELAHQWWGNLVTCADWSDFWMNEAFATFMVAAYKEKRWGRDEYDREIALSRRRYERIRRKGSDRALALPGRARPRDVEGPISYAKGSAVLHLLRYEIGDDAFWLGVRAFIRENAGGAVKTEALRDAMQRASGRDLGVFFRQWVHGAGVPDVVVQHRVEGQALVVAIEQRQTDLFQFPLALAVETDAGRERRRVLVGERRQEIRIPLAGALRSVRVDDGGQLPFAVAHERPVPMLLHMLRHEPDVAGRADALERLTAACAVPEAAQPCAPLHEALEERTKVDGSRLVRKLAADALEPSR